MQIQTNLGYTLSASEFLPLVPKVVATQQLFQRQDSDAPFFCEISGLDGKAERQATHRTCAYHLGHPDVFVMESTAKGMAVSDPATCTGRPRGASFPSARWVRVRLYNKV